MRKIILLLILSIALGACGARTTPKAPSTVKPAIKITVSPTVEPPTSTATDESTATVEPTSTPTPTLTETVVPTDTLEPTSTLAPTVTSTLIPIPSATPIGNIAPYPNAPLCSSHSNNDFHTMWNSDLGCHYDHEHGVKPFTQEVSSVFGVDLQALMGGVQIGHTNPSSPAENTAKHGGFKWDVALEIPCEIFESADWCVTDAAIQYHAFGNARIEMESRVHSVMALVKACNPNNPPDCGVLYVVQHVDYGQRVSQYQGDVLPYTEAAGCLVTVGCQANPVPGYASNFGPYNSIDRYGDCVGCRPSLAYVRDRRLNSSSTWTSKSTGPNASDPLGSELVAILFRVRDNYQLKDNADNTYPLTFGYVCSNDNGLTYNPAGCRYTNTTSQIHEVAGVIPSSWDNLSGWDTDPRNGRISVDGYVDQNGNPAAVCQAPGTTCFRIKMTNFFIGKYGGALPGSKISNPTPVSNPSNNIWFCNGVQCDETSPNAVPSGWVGPNN